MFQADRGRMVRIALLLMAATMALVTDTAAQVTATAATTATVAQVTATVAQVTATTATVAQLTATTATTAKAATSAKAATTAQVKANSVEVVDYREPTIQNLFNFNTYRYIETPYVDLSTLHGGHNTTKGRRVD